MRKPGWRRGAAADVMIRALPELELDGRGLVIDDDTGDVEAALSQTDVEVVPWRRRIFGGREARSWPEEGPCDFAVLRLPTAREAFRMALHAVAARLVPGGRLFVYGANDEGIRSAKTQLQPLFGEVEPVKFKYHCRVVQVVMNERPAELSAELAEWRRECTGKVADPDGESQHELRWISYPGVFAHGKIDKGTRFLLDELPDVAADKRLLDFGCGAGIVSKELRRRSPGLTPDLLEVDAIALEAARENVPGARTILSDSWRAVGDTEYDMVVSNPPVHTGKAQDFRIVRELSRGAAEHLTVGGEMWLVTQRTVPAKETLEAVFESVKIVHDGNFRVWRAKHPASQAVARDRG